jgi:hypothetical protein
VTELGPHLLGRKPSPPDERDWKLARFLASDGTLRDSAVAELKLTIRGYVDKRYVGPPLPGSHWAKALALLAQINAPVPIPSDEVVWVDPESVLDQGDYGTCVGNGWAQWGNTLPIDDRFVEKDARAIYYEATVIDGDPDDPDAPGGGQQGATVRAGVKAMKNRGRLAAYAFAASVSEVQTWLRAHGPVVIGSDWFDGMFSPDTKGYVKPTGSVAGGHCYVAIGDLPAEGALLFLNSWGEGWGLGGRFKMKLADFSILLGNQGEACATLELA